MPLSYVTIPVSEYRALMAEVKHGVEICDEMAKLRIALGVLERRLPLEGKVTLGILRKGIESADAVSRLRIELSSFERHLREFDQDLTPVRPSSRTDIQMAFENSLEFLPGGRKKPP